MYIETEPLNRFKIKDLSLEDMAFLHDALVTHYKACISSNSSSDIINKANLFISLIKEAKGNL